MPLLLRAKAFAGIAIDFACRAKDSAGNVKDSKDFKFASEHTSISEQDQADKRTTDDTDGTDTRSQDMSHELTHSDGIQPSLSVLIRAIRGSNSFDCSGKPH